MSQPPHQFVSTPEQAGQRLDRVIAGLLPLSRNQLKALFEGDSVKVNGRPARKGQLVEPGQTISVLWTEAPSDEVVPQGGETLRVLLEHPDFLFLDKKSGEPSHPLRPGETGTLANALVARFPECADASLEPREGGLCHRLDIETSGVILAARNRPAWEWARQAFSSQGIDKRYWALVTGPLADEGEIELPLKHHPRHPDRVVPAQWEEPKSRPAHSLFQVKARRGEYSLVEVKIVTGVLHQVRAHLSSIGAPIVNDGLYGGREVEGLGRFFLHAHSLSLPLPGNEASLKVHSPLPRDLASTLEALSVAIPPSP